MTPTAWKLQAHYGSSTDLPRIVWIDDGSGAGVELGFRARFTPTDPRAAITASIEEEVSRDKAVVAARQLLEQRRAKADALAKRFATHETRLAELERQRKDPGIGELEIDALVNTLSAIKVEASALETVLAAVRPALDLAKQHALAAQASLDGAIAIATRAAVNSRLAAANARKAQAQGQLGEAVGGLLDEMAMASRDLDVLHGLVRTMPAEQPATEKKTWHNAVVRSEVTTTRAPA